MAVAMSTTRRGLLKRLSTAAVAASLPVACSPGVVAAESVEEKVNRLSWEIADLLNAYGDGTCYAVIHPSDREEFAVAILKNVRA